MQAHPSLYEPLDLTQLGVRVWRGASGQRYREVSRHDGVVVLQPEYPCRGEKTTTVPVAMFEKLFEEVK